MTTPNNQDRLLSDEELEYRLGIMAMTTTQNQVVLLSKDQIKELMDFIHTQKRLYAERVIGEDERESDYRINVAAPTVKLPSDTTRTNIHRIGRNQLRAEQRARIK